MSIFASPASLLSLCEGIPPGTCRFTSQLMRRLDDLFNARLSNLLNIQQNHWLVEMFRRSREVTLMGVSKSILLVVCVLQSSKLSILKWNSSVKYRCDSIFVNYLEKMSLMKKFTNQNSHDDLIPWNFFPRYWPYVRGIHQWNPHIPTPIHHHHPQRPVARSCDVFVHVRLYKQLSCRWFEAPWRSCDVTVLCPQLLGF